MGSVPALEQQGNPNIRMVAKPLIHRVCENQRCCFAGGIVVLSAVHRGHPGRFQSPDRLLAGRRARELANSWRMEPRRSGKGAGPSKQKNKKKESKQLPAVSVCECFCVFSRVFMIR